jgi:hypothetical protein
MLKKSVKVAKTTKEPEKLVVCSIEDITIALMNER